MGQRSECRSMGEEKRLSDDSQRGYEEASEINGTCNGGLTENEAKKICLKSQFSLRLTEKGQVKSCFDNYVKILQLDNYLICLRDRK